MEKGFASYCPGDTFPRSILSLGGQQKGHFCLARGGELLVSPEFGDLGEAGCFLAYQSCLQAALRDLNFRPRIIAHDLHPDYRVSRWAPRLLQRLAPGADLVAVQHHHAHLAAALAESGRPGRAIGIAWDGTGYGDDGAVWGGEFFIFDRKSYQRAGHLEYVPLPGGEKAIEEPWRMAVSYLHHFWGKESLSLRLPFCRKLPRRKVSLLLQLMEKKLNAPPSSSMGRLFDAVAALTGLAWRNSYPAQAAAALEEAAEPGWRTPYPFGWERKNASHLIRLKKTFSCLVRELRKGTPTGEIAARFHHTVIKLGAETAFRISRESGLKSVILSGGVFQNRIIAVGLVASLKKHGLRAFLPVEVPVHDGSIAVGQALVANTLRSKK